MVDRKTTTPVREMGVLNQTKYILRKNYLIKRRNLRETLQEVLIPIWWILILFAIRLGVKSKELPVVKDSEIPIANVSSPGLTSFGSQSNSSRAIGYVINDVPNARLVIELISNHSKAAVNFIEFINSDSMLDYYRKYSASTGFSLGIEFAKGKNKGLAYTLRVSKKEFPKPDEWLVGKVAFILLHADLM